MIDPPTSRPRRPSRSRTAAQTPSPLSVLSEQITTCRSCPRLVEWRESVARERRAAYADWEYWGRAVPGFGDPAAGVLIVGLAPAAHGANRTGRLFTGDRSGDWLFRSLHRVGLANQSESTRADDGLALNNCWISAAVRCAPPENKPLPAERDACLPFLRREFVLLSNVKVIVPLGKFSFDVISSELGIRPRPKFGHGVEVSARFGERELTVLCSFHPSQQNTFTGKLTEEMLDSVMGRAAHLGAAAE